MITKGLEDYLELIYNNTLKNKTENRPVKAVDIANAFDISRSSVSETLIRLADLDLIVYKGRQGIEITEKGEKEALKIIKKHEVLSDFFHKILGINLETSNKNACRIEHVIDEEIIEAIHLFIKYCEKTSVSKNFKESKK